MARKVLAEKDFKECLNLVKLHGSVTAAAAATGLSRTTLHSRYERAYNWAKRTGKFDLSKLVSENLVDTATRQASGNSSREDILKNELTQTRNDLAASQRALKALTERASVEDRLVTDFKEHLKASPYRPAFTPPKKQEKTADDHEMLALVSDAHYPEVVEPEATFGLKYNADICRRRLEYLREKILRYRALRAESYNVRKLTVAVLGDMLSGSIHDELEITNEKPIGPALYDMTCMLYEMGLAFAEQFPKVEFIVMPGNHPRLTKVPRFKQKWNNFEHVMGLFLKAMAKDQFDVVAPHDIVYRHKIFDKVIGMTHGDGVKSNSFGGIPFYGMKQRADALQALLKSVKQQQIDLLVMGHFHQLIFQEGMGSSLIINGALKGGDEYSIGTRYSSQEAVQALITLHPRHGITDISRINVGHIQ